MKNEVFEKGQRCKKVVTRYTSSVLLETALTAGKPVSWLAGWLLDWLAGRLVNGLAGWLAGGLVTRELISSERLLSFLLCTNRCPLYPLSFIWSKTRVTIL